MRIKESRCGRELPCTAWSSKAVHSNYTGLVQSKLPKKLTEQTDSRAKRFVNEGEKK